MSRLVSFFLITLFSSLAFSQNTEEEKAIMQVIENVFEAMRKSDSTLLKTCFVEDANMFTAFTRKDGTTVLKKDVVQKFFDAVGTPKDQIWDEPIWNEKIQIDGPLASVWVDYAFYQDDQFLHCGVDAFQLFKQEGHWKIFHLTDTRRKADCVIPEEYQK